MASTSMVTNAISIILMNVVTRETRIDQEIGVVGVIESLLKIQGAWNKWAGNFSKLKKNVL